MRLEGFPPIAPENPRILIVGSFPGEESLRQSEYYAYKRNQFWRILGDILNEDLNEASYENKKDILKKHRIALWDSIGSCERKGSLDSSIKAPEFNDLRLFNVKRILCNGRKAYEQARRCRHDADLILLPSTSPANASMTYEEKKRVWEEAITININ